MIYKNLYSNPVFLVYFSFLLTTPFHIALSLCPYVLMSLLLRKSKNLFQTFILVVNIETQNILIFYYIYSCIIRDFCEISCFMCKKYSLKKQ